ncbi:DNA polymerase III subunit delta' [Herminiimonas sp. CN]|uniref:DNA polymerase III subunit delta' n=1 Tax=Herminiimonas sp. CN TaxID=1349818 RepID=UPI000474077D|nr:DNA polymerase III subunit delta' [Herminiimonas sp. CN]
MNNSIYPWQQTAWQQLQQQRDRLPHAILLHGAQGIGKTVFAEHLAQALLCDAPGADGHACGQCGSCGWFAQYSHPDYRRVRPEILEPEGGEAGSETESEDGKKSAKTAKAPSKEIKIGQIRALADFMNISTHRRGKRVIVLYPAEALNEMAANALLKTLEEPAPDTVFLLVTSNLERLLPTILSRCRKFALSMPSTEQALAWLQQQGVSDAAVWLAEEGGAPLAACAEAQAGNRDEIDTLLALLAKPSADALLKVADRLQKVSATRLVTWLQRWLFDLLSVKLAGKVRYYPAQHDALAALAKRIEPDALLRLQKAAGQRRAIAEHPLSAKLFIEDMLLDYLTLFP